MLYFILLIVASIGPGVLWLWYFYKQDRYEPEPLKQIVKTFIAGILLVIPAGVLEQIWRNQIMAAIQSSSWPALLIVAFLVVSLIEEGFKSGFLWWLVGRNPDLNEPVDGAIYGITLGLGFASLENFLWAGVFGLGVAALRAIVTTLAHASFTGWMGYFIAKYKLVTSKRFTLAVGFLLAFASHGLYDFLLFLRNSPASLAAFLLIAALLIRLFHVMQKQVLNSPFKK